MYARSTTLHGDPSAADAAVAFYRDHAWPTLRDVGGCLGMSMVLDRESGRAITTTSWDSEKALRTSTHTAAHLHQEGATLLRAARPVVEEWEIASSHRVHDPGPASWVRRTWSRVPPTHLDLALGHYRDYLLQHIEHLDGFTGASLMVNRDLGRTVLSVTYDNRAALEATRAKADDLRARSTNEARVELLDVAELELAVAHLRLPEIIGTTDEMERKRLRDDLVMLNMDVAGAIASRYRDRGIAMEDLLQAAYVGLVKAARGFDPTYERGFLSYAVPTVTGEVKRYFRDYGWTVRPPRRIQELQAQISRASNELFQSLHRSPKPSEVAEVLGIDENSVIEAQAANGCFTPTSLDVPVGEDSSGSLGERLGGEDEDLGRAEARILLGPAVRRLEERDRWIIELRFFHGWTQEQIAQDIGVTQMQVSRLLSRILSELRAELG